jgi:hypothetical protein
MWTESLSSLRAQLFIVQTHLDVRLLCSKSTMALNQHQRTFLSAFDLHIRIKPDFNQSHRHTSIFWPIRGTTSPRVTAAAPTPDRSALTSRFPRPSTCEPRGTLAIYRAAPAMNRQAENPKTKLDLPFILNKFASGRPRRQRVTREQTTHRQEQDAPSSVAVAAAATTNASTVNARVKLTRAQKKKKRECTVDGCSNYIVHKGLCCKHGVRATDTPLRTPWRRETERLKPTTALSYFVSHQGGKKCAHDGCTTSAKHNNCCWKHGEHSVRWSSFLMRVSRRIETNRHSRRKTQDARRWS